MTQFLKLAKSVLLNRIPGQLIVQMTDQCNARCPQCGMRVTESFKRSTLPVDKIKHIIDEAARLNIQAISFTGGEPMLHLNDLIELIHHAGAAGIPYIRTGTNGFLFKNADHPDFTSKITHLVDRLQQTPLRNFWISIDSAIPEVHESMRGFQGIIKGIEKALPVFHDAGIYPSANLGINRNVGGSITRSINPGQFNSEDDYLSHFYRRYTLAFGDFYQFVINMGFTMVNTCYPMSIGGHEEDCGLKPVYAASAVEDVVRFSNGEKQMLYKALMKMIPTFRNQVRIFSPLSSLYALCRQYKNNEAPEYKCSGGIDFFFIDSKSGHTYPCGYRGNEDMGEWGDHMPAARNLRKQEPFCVACDWECFRDPSELFGPVLQLFRQPLSLLLQVKNDPEYLRTWIQDIQYYRACCFFDGRLAPDYEKLNKYNIKTLVNEVNYAN